MPGEGATSTGASPAQREYGCLTCVAKFDGSVSQRAHMRGEWHVYNLKRRMASLPALSEVEFNAQPLPSTTKPSDAEAPISFQRSCIACEQHYTNPRAWQAHRRSQSHAQKDAEFRSNTPSRTDKASPPIALSLDEGQSSDDEEAEEEFNPQQCLFCNVESMSLDTNLTHMSHAHGFFIPDAEHLFDTESFLSYLFAVVTVFRECLFCGSPRTTKFGVQDHMRGKAHCKLNLEHDEHQLSQFYDMSEDMSGQNDDGELGGEETPVLDDGERLLPSGKVVGHRSLARSSHHNYSKRPSSGLSSQQQQRLSEPETEIANTTPELTMELPDRKIAMRAGTSSSLIGLSEFQRRALMAVELKMEKTEARARNEYHSKVEKGGNKQKTYRVLTMGKKAGGLEKRLG